MKFRVLLSLLFIISTTFAAVHEIEHINHDHDSSTCLECTVSHNFLSADNSSAVYDFELQYTKEIEPQVQTFKFHIKKTDNHSTAPPFIS